MRKSDETALGLLILGGGLLFLMLTGGRAKAAVGPPPGRRRRPTPPPEPRAVVPAPPAGSGAYGPEFEVGKPDPLHAYGADLNSEIQSARQGPLLGFGADVTSRESPFSKAWTRGNLAAVVEAVGLDMGVAPELIWGVLLRESAHMPVGVFAHDRETQSTEYGIGQITRPRWNAEASQATAPWGTTHVDQIHPELAVVAIAQSYLRGQAKHGGDISPEATGYLQAIADYNDPETTMGQAYSLPSWVGPWWARPADIGSSPSNYSEGSQRKLEDIHIGGRELRVLAGELAAAVADNDIERLGDNAPRSRVVNQINEFDHGMGIAANLVQAARANNPGAFYGSTWRPGEVDPDAAQWFQAGSAFFPEFERRVMT